MPELVDASDDSDDESDEKPSEREVKATAVRDEAPSLCYVCARPNGGVRSPGGVWVCCMKCPKSGGHKHTQGCDDRCRIDADRASSVKMSASDVASTAAS